jgi:hypothetical protein
MYQMSVGVIILLRVALMILTTCCGLYKHLANCYPLTPRAILRTERPDLKITRRVTDKRQLYNHASFKFRKNGTRTETQNLALEVKDGLLIHVTISGSLDGEQIGFLGCNAV